MKISTVLAFAAVTLGSASPVDKRAAVNITETFDNYIGKRLNLVNSSFGQSQGLYYKGMGLAEIYDTVGPLQSVNAQSKKNVLAYGDLDRLKDDYPYITSKFAGSNGTFDLLSLYYGCILGNVAGRCTIIIAGYRNGVRIAGTSFNFQPATRQSANMTQVVLGSTWKGLDGVRFLTVFTDRASNPGLGGASFLDNVKFTYTAA